MVWSAIGGSLWAAYTALLAYSLWTALADSPVAPVLISNMITAARQLAGA